ncbi:MAG: hypothetical protein JKY43_09195 [Phycisphaerales bacterium]|nr:hypothetical protein [Phycisphaerales bacterium]
MVDFLTMVGIGFVAVAGGAVVLHVVAKMGGFGKGVMEFLRKAPGLDLVVAWFTIGPAVGGLIVFGWRGLLGGIVGQMIGLTVWGWGHEFVHRKAVKGPRIVKVLNRLVGRWRNHGALWVSALAVPLFWAVRIGELVIYPLLIWLLRFPKHKQGEWINVSRHKFDGLVGHDLIWCLYCDWMTGVWSLGSEMLRNVESFWCPIRFSDTNKCANCSVDFPDIWRWVADDGKMEDVVELLEEKYGIGKDGGDAGERPDRNSWFGHKDRGGRVELTVEGEKRAMGNGE